MRQLCVQMSMSLDGFVAGPQGELAWQFANQDESAEHWALERAWQAGAHLMGSHTYHDMAGWWPSSTELFAPAMNQIPKVVFSKDPEVTARSKWTPIKTTRDSGQVEEGPPRATASVSLANEKSWVEARVMSGDLAKDIAQLKSEPGKDLIAWGGAGFCRSLTRLGLADELVLTIYPVAIGKGLSIFSELPDTIALQLQSCTTFSKGVVSHVYRTKPKAS